MTDTYRHTYIATRTEIQTDTAKHGAEKHRQADIQRETGIQRYIQTHRQTEMALQIDRQSQRQPYISTYRQTQTEIHTDRDTYKHTCCIQNQTYGQTHTTFTDTYTENAYIQATGTQTQRPHIQRQTHTPKQRQTQSDLTRASYSHTDRDTDTDAETDTKTETQTEVYEHTKADRYKHT